MRFSWIVLIAAVLSLSTALAITLVVFELDADSRDHEFLGATESISRDIESTLLIHSDLVEQLGAAIGVSPSMTRQQFSEYTMQAHRSHSHPAIRAVEWIPYVSDTERSLFVRSAVEDGFSDFEITQRNDGGELVTAFQRSNYYPVYYVEPLSGNEAAVGFDLGSNNERLAAITKSIDSRSQIASAPISLVQRSDQSFGFLIFSPVYIWETDTFIGFALGVFDVDGSIVAALNNTPISGVQFSITDVTDDVSTVILRGSVSDTGLQLSSLSNTDGKSISRSIFVVDREWEILFSPSPGSFERSTSIWGIPLFGIIASFGIIFAVSAFDRKRKTDMSLLVAEIEKSESERHVVELQLDNQTQRARMIDSVSHELRTPLTIVMARADLLSMKLPADNERAITDLSAIKKGATELNTMINSLIDHAERFHSASSPEKSNIEVSKLVEQAVARASDSEFESEITIADVDQRSINCDIQFTTRALWELLDNASKYGPESAPIRVSAEEENGAISFSVEDEGTELSLEQGRELFQPFERGRSTGMAGKRGLGLGLSFVRSVAEIHGGRAYFEKSIEGHSIFVLSIPTVL